MPDPDGGTVAVQPVTAARWAGLAGGNWTAYSAYSQLSTA
jgi:hypothetical protein